MSNQTPIRVMLVDDHAVVRSGLSKFLMVYPDLELVGEADSGEGGLHGVDDRMLAVDQGAVAIEQDEARGWFAHRGTSASPAGGRPSSVLP